MIKHTLCTQQNIADKNKNDFQEATHERCLYERSRRDQIYSVHTRGDSENECDYCTIYKMQDLCLLLFFLIFFKKSNKRVRMRKVFLLSPLFLCVYKQSV